MQCDAAVAGQVRGFFTRILRQPSRVCLSQEKQMSPVPGYSGDPAWVMKPSPGENKFGDGDSCGMHGLRFSASPDGDGHLSPDGHPGALLVILLQLFFLAGLHRIVGRLAEPGNDATAVSRTGEADSSSMICWFADARVCGSQVSILSAQSPQTASSSSLECAIHGAVWAPPLGHGCA